MKNNEHFINKGKRKRGKAKVCIISGTGNILINNRKLEDYMQDNPKFSYNIKLPLSILELERKYDIIIESTGGGLCAQTEAIKLAIARTIYHITTEENKKLLKENKLLSCNSKRKERKKYGLKKARKSPQFSKR